METKHLLVVTTTDNLAEAKKLAEIIVKKRLAACAQVEGPLNSTYWWQGKIENAEEWKCSFKTSANLYPKLEAEIRKSHSYETPEIIALPILRGNAEYLNWLDKEIQPDKS